MNFWYLHSIYKISGIFGGSHSHALGADFVIIGRVFNIYYPWGWLTSQWYHHGIIMCVNHDRVLITSSCIILFFI